MQVLKIHSTSLIPWLDVSTESSVYILSILLQKYSVECLINENGQMQEVLNIVLTEWHLEQGYI